MTEEEKKTRDNIALVAMQCMLNRKRKLNLYHRIKYFILGIEYFDDPYKVASIAYGYADAMMEKRNNANKKM